MLTLFEASKVHSYDAVRSGVIEHFARSNDLLRAMQWIDCPGAYVYNQEAVLPGVGFRGLNQAWPESTGIINPQVEVLRFGGGELDVDKKLLKGDAAAVRTLHEFMKVKALALFIAKKMIKGNSVLDPLEFDGLQNRIVGSQLINAGATNGGDPLSLIKLDEAIDAVDGPTHLLMSKAMRRRLTAAARATGVGGFITYEVDEFGRQITFYDSLPILIADEDETGARVLDFDEVGPGGSTATATSIYVLSIGPDKLIGLQGGTMEVNDLGELETKPALRTRVEWDVGLAALHARCAARVWGISNAAVVV